MRRKKLDEKGFSFIELVIVVAVIGILTAIAIPSYGGIQASAKQAAVDATADNGLRLVAAHAVSGGEGTPDEKLRTLVGDDVDARFLDKNGAVVSNPNDDICVWAYNKKELNGNGSSKYQALKGDCAGISKEGLVVPGAPGTPGGNEPGAGEEVTGPNTNAATAKFTLQCPATVSNFTPQVAGFSGTQKWSDGEELQGMAARELQAGVTYELELLGNYSSYKAMDFGAMADFQEKASCLKKVDSWGINSGVTSIAWAGAYANNLEYMAPPVASVRDMSFLFYSNSSFNEPVNHWNVSGVENLSYVFAAASSFDQPLNNWKPSQATTLQGMFQMAGAFNQPVNDWDVRKVQSIASIFSMSKFDQPLNGWRTESLTDASYAFMQNTEFNQPLNNWDVSDVTNFSNMFNQANKFNGSLAGWNTGSATNMQSMFNGAWVFDQNLSGWNVTNVANSSDFAGAGSGLADQPNKQPRFN